MSSNATELTNKINNAIITLKILTVFFSFRLIDNISLTLR